MVSLDRIGSGRSSPRWMIGSDVTTIIALSLLNERHNCAAARDHAVKITAEPELMKLAASAPNDKRVHKSDSGCGTAQ